MATDDLLVGVSPETNKPIYLWNTMMFIKVLKSELGLDAETAQRKAPLGYRVPTKSEMAVVFNSAAAKEILSRLSSKGPFAGWYWTSTENENPEEKNKSAYAARSADGIAIPFSKDIRLPVVYIRD